MKALSRILSLGVAFACATVPADSQVTTIGLGNQSCGAWTRARRENRGGAIGFENWLGGYFTGLNEANGTRFDLTRGTDFSGLAAWIDNYCVVHPIDPVALAASHLAAELLIRNRR